MSPDIDTEIRQQDLVRIALTVAGAAEAIALGLVGSVRVLAICALGAAAWLTYWVTSAFGTGPLLSALTLLPLCLPGAALGLSYWLLRSSIGLPRRIMETAESAYGISHAALRDAKAEYVVLRSTGPRLRPRELWRLGTQLRHLRKLPGDASELLVSMGRALAIANPVFMIGTAVSAISAAALIGAAAITLLVRFL